MSWDSRLFLKIDPYIKIKKRCLLMADMENPKLFISYSWSSADHEKFVLQIASKNGSACEF